MPPPASCCAIFGTTEIGLHSLPTESPEYYLELPMLKSALALLPVLWILTTSLAAGRDLDQDEALKLTREGQIMPLEQLLHSISRIYPNAQLLEVDLEEHHGHYVYEIDLLTAEGLARELELDARTGRLISDKEDD